MSTHPTARAAAIGRVIAETMSQKGWRNNDLIDKLAWSPAKVSRLRHGHRHLKPTDLAMALAVLDIKDPERHELLAVSEDLHRANVWLPPEMSPTARARFLTRLILVASRLDAYAINNVPLQLQSPDYHRFLNSDDAGPVAHRDHRTEGPQFTPTPRSRFFVGETALTHTEMPPEILSDQIHHLLRLAVRPEIDIRIVPEPTNLPGCPPFTYLTFNEHRPLVHLDVMNTSAFLEHPNAIRHCSQILATLTQRALPTDATKKRLLDLATELASSAEAEPSGGTCNGSDPSREGNDR